MTNLRKLSTSHKVAETLESKNVPDIENAPDWVSINLRTSKRIKGKSLNIHNLLAHRGGIREIILSLNAAIQEINLGPEGEKEKRCLETLRQLRDLLIKEHYGLNTWSLIEFLLA